MFALRIGIVILAFNFVSGQFFPLSLFPNGEPQRVIAIIVFPPVTLQAKKGGGMRASIPDSCGTESFEFQSRKKPDEEWKGGNVTSKTGGNWIFENPYAALVPGETIFFRCNIQRRGSILNKPDAEWIVPDLADDFGPLDPPIAPEDCPEEPTTTKKPDGKKEETTKNPKGESTPSPEPDEKNPEKDDEKPEKNDKTPEKKNDKKDKEPQKNDKKPEKKNDKDDDKKDKEPEKEGETPEKKNDKDDDNNEKEPEKDKDDGKEPEKSDKKPDENQEKPDDDKKGPKNPPKKSDEDEKDPEDENEPKKGGENPSQSKKKPNKSKNKGNLQSTECPPPEPEGEETREEALERKLFKVQCDMLLLAERSYKLNEALNNELIELKKLNYGVVSRIQRLESLVRRFPPQVPFPYYDL